MGFGDIAAGRLFSIRLMFDRALIAGVIQAAAVGMVFPADEFVGQRIQKCHNKDNQGGQQYCFDHKKNLRIMKKSGSTGLEQCYCPV